MSDAYCQKHFIQFCPDLSKTCPYCRINELEARAEADVDIIKRQTKRINELEDENVKYKEAWSVNILTERISELEAKYTALLEELKEAVKGWSWELSEYPILKDGLDAIIEQEVSDEDVC